MNNLNGYEAMKDSILVLGELNKLFDPYMDINNIGNHNNNIFNYIYFTCLSTPFISVDKLDGVEISATIRNNPATIKDLQDAVVKDKRIIELLRISDYGDCHITCGFVFAICKIINEKINTSHNYGHSEKLIKKLLLCIINDCINDDYGNDVAAELHNLYCKTCMFV